MEQWSCTLCETSRRQARKIEIAIEQQESLCVWVGVFPVASRRREMPDLIVYTACALFCGRGPIGQSVNNPSLRLSLLME